jgi:hypothetical protein
MSEVWKARPLSWSHQLLTDALATFRPGPCRDFAIEFSARQPTDGRAACGARATADAWYRYYLSGFGIDRT